MKTMERSCTLIIAAALFGLPVIALQQQSAMGQNEPAPSGGNETEEVQEREQEEINDSASDAAFQEAQDEEARMIARTRGEAALAEAEHFSSQGNWVRASAKYAETLNYLPNNQAAMDGLAEAQTMLNQQSTLTDTEQRIREQRQKALIEFDDAFAQAQAQLAQGNYVIANRAIVQAKLKLSNSRGVLTVAEFERLNLKSSQLIEQIEEERIAQAALEAQARIEQASQDKSTAERRASAQRERLIAENMRRVRQLQMELKYREALQVIDEILFIDPNNAAALTLRDIMMTTELYVDYAEMTRLREWTYAEMDRKGMAATIGIAPNISGPGPKSKSGLISYPEDWPQITMMRAGEGWANLSAEDQIAMHRMDNTAVPVQFAQHDFSQTMRFFEQVTEAPMYVDWKALNTIGVAKDTPVDVHLAEMPASRALTRVLEQMGDDFERPEWVVEDGMVVVSTESALRRRTTTDVYDIRDLLAEIPQFDSAPELDRNAPGTQRRSYNGTNMSMASSDSLFDDDDQADKPTREDTIDRVVSIIQENIDPAGWQSMGGTTGRINEFNGNLIITNTPKNHQDITGLLSELREVRALQVNIEARFLSVATNWFERIGIDLDLYFNTNNDMWGDMLSADPNAHLSDFFNTTPGARQFFAKDPAVIYGGIGDTINPAAPPYINTISTGTAVGVPAGGGQVNYIQGPVGTPIALQNGQGFAPIGVQQNSLGLTDLLAGVTNFGGQILNANPAIGLGIQFLDDIQVDLLIEATQADRRNVTLTAPRLTCFNGQRADVAVITQQAYVANLIPVVGEASGAFQPDVEILDYGFVLDVDPVISADRRYVTMTVRWQYSVLEKLESLNYSGATGANVIPGQSNDFNGEIQLPITQLTIVNTTVSIPDKGTVLIGGQRKVTEIEVEVGVPVLSKVPWLNRFFTNRVTEKEEKNLLILVRPEIIVQQENEDLLFPGLSDSVSTSSSYIR